jgi:hypothetical protein
MSSLTRDEAKMVLDLMNAPNLTVSTLIEELEKIERVGGGNLPVKMHDDTPVREVCAYDADGNVRGPHVEVIIHGFR